MKFGNYVLPDPLPDEALISLIIRAYYRNGETDAKRFIERVCNIHPNNLAIANFIKFTSEPEEAYQLTVYPWFLNCVPEKQTKEIMELILKDGRINNLFAINNKKDSSLYLKGLRYCPICVKEDIQNFGIPYYHKSHLIGGIDVCCFHGCKLRFIDEVNGFNDLINLKDDQIEYSDKEEIKLAELLNNFNNLSQDKLNSYLHIYFKEKNFIDNGNIIKHKKVYDVFKKIYDHKFLEKHGITSSKSLNFLQKLSKNDSFIHPFYYLLIINAFNLDINNIKEHSSKIYFSKKSYLPKKRKCRNPYCNNLVFSCYRENKRSYYKCDCGCVFTDTRNIPLQYGEDFLTNLMNDLKHSNYSEVSKFTGISVGTLKKIRSSPPNPNIIDNKINMAVDQALLCNNRKELHDKFEPAYNLLLKFKREWLEDLFPLIITSKPYTSERIEDLDKEYLNFLISKEAEFKKSNDRLNIRFFLDLLEISDYANLRNKYPLTWRFILDNIENIEEHYLRRSKLALINGELKPGISKRSFIKYFKTSNCQSAYDRLKELELI